MSVSNASTRHRSDTTLSRSSSSSGERDQKQKAKQNSLKSFFGVKEPSAVAFHHLAEQQKKDLAAKKQDLPFGVSSGTYSKKAAEEDYRKAKERAKEKARWYHEARERQLAQEKHDEALEKLRAETHPPSELERLSDEVLRLRIQTKKPDTIEYRSLDPMSSSTPGQTPIIRKTHRRWKAPSLDSLPETPIGSSTQSSQPSLPLTPPAAYEVTRKEVAPWEEEEEFPMRESSKKKGSFSSFRRL